MKIEKIIKENRELNRKYLNAIADYETTISELQKYKENIGVSNDNKNNV